MNSHVPDEKLWFWGVTPVHPPNDHYQLRQIPEEEVINSPHNSHNHRVVAIMVGIIILIYIPTSNHDSHTLWQTNIAIEKWQPFIVDLPMIS